VAVSLVSGSIEAAVPRRMQGPQKVVLARITQGIEREFDDFAETGRKRVLRVQAHRCEACKHGSSHQVMEQGEVQRTGSLTNVEMDGEVDGDHMRRIE
jgi:hypothetical protein